MDMRVKMSIIIILMLAVQLVSCGRGRGTFAFKQFGNDSYRKLVEGVSFRSGESVQWIYSFDSVSSRFPVGVILNKKNITWIDINTVSDYADSEKPIIYGTLKDLSKGEYKIILTDVEDENRIIDSFRFEIYEK